MKHVFSKSGMLIAVGTLMLTACGEKDKEDPRPETESKYVVMTSSNISNANRPGYMRVFDAFPAGNISTAENSLQGTGMAGWRPYKNWLLKMFNSSGNEQGIERLVIGANNIPQVDKFLKADPVYSDPGIL